MQAKRSPLWSFAEDWKLFHLQAIAGVRSEVSAAMADYIASDTAGVSGIYLSSFRQTIFSLSFTKLTFSAAR